MGVQYGASGSSLASAPTHSLGEWRNLSNDANSSNWVAPSLWATSSSNTFPVHPVRLASGRLQEVVPPAERVHEHSAERVQAMPKIGQN